MIPLAALLGQSGAGLQSFQSHLPIGSPIQRAMMPGSGMPQAPARPLSPIGGPVQAPPAGPVQPMYPVDHPPGAPPVSGVPMQPSDPLSPALPMRPGFGGFGGGGFGGGFGGGYPGWFGPQNMGSLSALRGAF